jgi:hypothetical protein
LIVAYYFSIVTMAVIIVRRGTTGDAVSAFFKGEKRGASGDTSPATTSLVYKQESGGAGYTAMPLFCPGWLLCCL